MDYYSEIREFLESNGGFWMFEDEPFLWSETNKFETIEIHGIFIDDDDDLSISYYFDHSSRTRVMKVNNLNDPDGFLEKAYYLI